MISVDPAQARAFRAWVLATLNLDDNSETESPAPFDESTVRWSPTDYPTPRPLYAMIREISLVERGQPDTTRKSFNRGEVDETLVVQHSTISDWTVSVQVVSKLDPENPALEQAAGQYLRRLRARTLADGVDDMRLLGVAWCRSGQILPLDRIAKNAEWETRAALDLTFVVGDRIVEQPGWIDSAEVTGTLSPLESETFTVDQTTPDLDDL